MKKALWEKNSCKAFSKNVIRDLAYSNEKQDKSKYGYRQHGKEKQIPNVNPVKPPVLSESKPEATDEVSIRCGRNGAGACLAVASVFRTGVRETCMKK